MRQRRMLGAVSVAVLTASILTGSPGVSAPGQAAPAAVQAPSRWEAPRTVTLISGDRITVHGNGKLSMQPRKGVHFLKYSANNHQYVIPSDAISLLRGDRLDLRLFDLTGLLEAGYDKRDGLSVIVTGSASARAIAPSGLKVSRQLPVVRGFAASGNAGQLKAYWQSLQTAQALRAGGEKIWLDGVRKPLLDVSVPQVGAPAAWQAGLDGTGVKVAVLDTGIDSAHPDLAGKVVAAQNFAAEAEEHLDLVGHGTHVASTVAGTGAASGGKYKGVAPGASLLDGKVCARFGCMESWILGGMQWAAESGAQVVNMSLGGSDGPEIDPIEAAVNDLTAQFGTLFVIASGNSGNGGPYTLSSPASAEAALAVGAVYKDDKLAEFSSRGPRIGDGAVKPEITAPGVQIAAAKSKDGLGLPAGSYFTASGTSMATPHVAGAAAIVTQQHPQWTAAQRKAALTSAANPNSTNTSFEQGAGRLDVARATTATVVAVDPVASFGIQPFPHDDDPILNKTVTYQNNGTAAVTLNLTLSNTYGGIFSLSASSVTVAAGGTASVTLTSNTRNGTVHGAIGGTLTASADGVRVQVPYGVDREEQKYTIDLNHISRDGQPADFYFTVAINLETGKNVILIGDESNTERQLRLVGGVYTIFSWVDDLSEEGEYLGTAQLLWPKLSVSGDQDVAMDARLGRGLNITLPHAGVVPEFGDITGRVEHNGRSVTIGVSGDVAGLLSAHLGPKPVAGVSSQVQAIAVVMTPEQELKSMYNVGWYINDGTFVTGFTKNVQASELAAVKYSAAKHSADLGEIFQYPELPAGGFGIGFVAALPQERTDYLLGGLEYTTEFTDLVENDEGWYDPVSWQVSAPTAYPAGRTSHEKFNSGVFGTTFPKSRWPDAWITRIEDTIVVSPPLFSDSGGHAGFGVYTKARTALYRNGTLVAEDPSPYGYYEVPAEQAAYRLESHIERSARLSTKVTSTWTFSSATTTDWKQLPVSAVSFSPQLSADNTAQAGALMLIPAKVWQQEGAKRVKTFGLQVSFDDGQTWAKAPVISVLGVHYVIVKNPKTAGFVSLRTSAVDAAGNKFDQTIIRAYEVK